MLEWLVSPELVVYKDAIAVMEQRTKAIAQGISPEMVWLLEHPPLYTAGTSAKKSDLRDPKGLPVYDAGRGGQYTYHGPGQRIAYVMIDLAKRVRDIRLFVNALEQWVIDALGIVGIKGELRKGRVGIWVVQGGLDHKIAAIGVRLHKWVSYHGIAINVNPDLRYFKGIVPCGLPGYGVTSLQALGLSVTMEVLDEALQGQWNQNAYLAQYPQSF